MEHCEGGDLFQHLQGCKHLTEPEVPTEEELEAGDACVAR